MRCRFSRFVLAAALCGKLRLEQPIQGGLGIFGDAQHFFLRPAFLLGSSTALKAKSSGD